MEIDFRSALKLQHPLAVVGFPTTGLAAVIAAQFLVEKLPLPLVGSLWSRTLPPATLVRNGKWEPPVAVYGKAMACGPKGKCKSLLVATSAVPLEREAFWDVASGLADVFTRQHVDLTVVLDSEPVEEAVDPTHVRTVAQGPEAKAVAKALGLPAYSDGILSGVTAALLVEARRRKQNVVVLVTEAHEKHPDSRGAAYLVKVLDDGFVRVGMDLAPLIDQAARIEQSIRKTQRQAALTEQRTGESVATMYR